MLRGALHSCLWKGIPLRYGHNPPTSDRHSIYDALPKSHVFFSPKKTHEELPLLMPKSLFGRTYYIKIQCGISCGDAEVHLIKPLSEFFNESVNSLLVIGQHHESKRWPCITEKMILKVNVFE